MIEGNAYGLNWKGLYDPELVAHYAAQWRRDPSAFSQTVKLVALGGKYALDNYYGAHYAKARDLEPALTAAYDAALATYDVLVMPTVPITATAIPPGDAPVGLPVGLMVIGKKFDDAGVLSAAHAFEAVLGTLPHLISKTRSCQHEWSLRPRRDRRARPGRRTRG